MVKKSLVRVTLAFTVHGGKQARTPSGKIDVLSGTEVIEVKHCSE